MLLAFIAAAVSSPELDQVERCRAAVHGALETAAVVCKPSSGTVDLWKPETAADRCTPALVAGVDAGKMGPTLPPRMREGLVRHFDQALAACLAPQAAEVPTIDQVNLWD